LSAFRDILTVPIPTASARVYFSFIEINEALADPAQAYLLIAFPVVRRLSPVSFFAPFHESLHAATLVANDRRNRETMIRRSMMPSLGIGSHRREKLNHA
jgi:hypothetical protein